MQLPSGTALGSFVIDVRLASDGSSEIYRAHHPKLGRSVRIERLPDRPDAPGNPAPELDRELRLRARLQHPNVAQLYDCFVHQGAIYLATEEVDGPSLAELIEIAAPIPVEIALQLGLELLRGLAEIHERGIVHGDLQPRNLRMARTGETKIVGFEHAREAGSMDPAGASGDAPPSTAEHLTGGRRLPASDICSFGRTLQQLLSRAPMRTDSRPFPGVSRRLERMLRASLREDPTQRPRARDLRDALARELGEPGPLDCRVSLAAWFWEAESGSDRPTGSRDLPAAGKERRLGFSSRRRALAAIASAATILLAGLLWVGYERSVELRDVAAPRPALGQAPGLISFVAHPWAEIQVDDLPPFYTPQATPLELSPGEHRVVFRHPTLGSREKTLHVAPGERRRVIEVLGSEP